MVRKSVWEPEQTAKFSQLLGELMKEAGPSGRDISSADVSRYVRASPAWVSGVLAGKINPSRERTVALSKLLGPKLLDASPFSSDQPDDLIYMAPPLLWAGRAQMLSLLSGQGRTPDVQRFRRLVSEALVESAAQHPLGEPFSQNGRLQYLREIAQEASPMTRRLVLVELAGMQIDAPYNTEISREERLNVLELIASDLDLPDAGPTLCEALASIPDPADRRDLPSVGGPAGQLSARLVGTDVNYELLLGSDPAGWIGTRQLAGTWLARPSAPKPEEKKKRTNVLLPLDPPLRSVQYGLTIPTAPLEFLPESTVDPLSFALRLGPGWTTVERTKLQSFYITFNKDITPEEMNKAGLPDWHAMLSGLDWISEDLEDTHNDFVTTPADIYGMTGRWPDVSSKEVFAYADHYALGDRSYECQNGSRYGASSVFIHDLFSDTWPEQEYDTQGGAADDVSSGVEE